MDRRTRKNLGRQNLEMIEIDRILPRSCIRMPHPNLAGLSEQPGSPHQLHRKRIGESMRDHGWDDYDPLLVHDCGDGFYQAWMGMHRLLAAEDAWLTDIPVVIITQEQLRSIGFTDSEISHDPWQTSARLARLSDQRPHQLMQRADEDQRKRGF